MTVVVSFIGVNTSGRDPGVEVAGRGVSGRSDAICLGRKELAGYVDGYVLPIEEAAQGHHRRMAMGRKAWISTARWTTGCAGDASPRMGHPFAAYDEAGRTVVFAYIVFSPRIATASTPMMKMAAMGAAERHAFQRSAWSAELKPRR
jgi:hypothetical protein